MRSALKFARRRLSLLTVALGLALATAVPAGAQYPDKPIRLLLPFPAGGTVDLVARLVTAQMAEDLGRPFVIENRAGAGGVIATDATAKAVPDGYTLMLTTPNHTINAALNPKLPYDTEKDIAPISIIAEIPELLVSHPSAPFDSLAGFVEYAKRNPGKLNYASAGNGTLPHLTMELLLRRLGIEVAHIPYRGAAPAMTDLLAGQVQLKMDTYATARQLVAEGKLRALAFASRERSPLMPDVPTVAEAGYPGAEYLFWGGLFVPSKTPPEIVRRLYVEGRDAAEVPATKTALAKLGYEARPMTPAEFQAFFLKDFDETVALAKKVGIKPND